MASWEGWTTQGIIIIGQFWRSTVKDLRVNGYGYSIPKPFLMVFLVGHRKAKLVGGFNPFEKYYRSQNGNLPQVEVKKQIFETTT